MARSRFGTVLLSVLVASFVAATARAQTEAIPIHPALTDKFTFELGAFFTKSNTNASLTPPAGGSGVIVNFEDTLGLDERNIIPSGGFLWRFRDNWRVEVGYFQLDRSATRTLATDVTWGNTVFPVGSTVDSSYDIYDIRTSVGYSFFKRPDKEIGVGLGLHVMKLKGTVQSAGIGVEAAKVTAPLPVVNFFAAFALTNEWALRARMDWLSLSYKEYSGDIRSTAIDVLYQPFRHVGFGLGMHSLIVDIDIDDPSWQGKARTSVSGPSAFITVSF